MASELSSHQKKSAELLCISIEELAKKYGLERLGFFTLTFKERRISAKEAQRRWHSLRTNILSKRYREIVRVRERMKSGAIHYHLIIVLPVDIRTGVDFDAFERMDYKTASKGLKDEWSFWRKTCVAYGFGRHELLPVKSTAQGIARYVGKYVSKDVAARLPEDKGARLVEYSKGARAGTTRFSRVSVGSWLWRQKVAGFAKKHGCSDLTDLASLFGPHWVWHHRETIMDFRLSEWPTAAHARADSSFNSSGIPDDAVDIRYSSSGDTPVSPKAYQLERKREVVSQLLTDLNVLAADCVPWSPVPPPKERAVPSEFVPPGQDRWFPEVVKDYLGNAMRDKKGRVHVRWRISIAGRV